MKRTDNAPLAVLMISPQFYPIIGGYERAAARLSKGLAELGVKVVVITERRHLSWRQVEHLDGYKVRRLFCVYRRRFHVITSLFSFAGFLLRSGRTFNVWHVHQSGPHSALALAFGAILRRPVVLKTTSVNDTQKVGRLRKFLNRWVTACVATSEESRAEAIRFGVRPETVHYIPNGVDGQQFMPASAAIRHAARLSLGMHCARLVLYVGRLSPEKNPLGLLEAWAVLAPNVRAGSLLVLVGGGPEWDKVRARAEAPELVGTVHLAGESSDVRTWYQAADIYVISSHREGLSNTMIEALASGLPVISTRVSGSSILAEVPATGIVVDVRNVRMLADALTTLLEDEEARARLSENARLKFESHFSLDTISMNMKALYGVIVERDEPTRRID